MAYPEFRAQLSELLRLAEIRIPDRYASRCTGSIPRSCRQSGLIAPSGRSLVFSRTALVVFNRPLYRAQMKTLRREINKRCRKLKTLHKALQKSAKRARGKKPIGCIALEYRGGLFQH